MKLYMACPVGYARHVYTNGFAGRSRVLYDPEKLAKGAYVRVGVEEFCDFRDMPPRGLTLSLTAEAKAEMTDHHSLKIEIAGGPVLADDMGDFVLSIVVPDAEARRYEIHEDPPWGWPFREYWLPPDVANKYRDSLEVWVPETNEQVPADVLLSEHAVIVTERFGFVLPPRSDVLGAMQADIAGEELTAEQDELLDSATLPPALPAAAICVCGERWRWDGHEDQEAAFATWSLGHISA